MADPSERMMVWWSALVECRVCTHRHCMVIPAPRGAPCPRGTECPRCGGMTCDPVDGDDPDPADWWRSAR